MYVFALVRFVLNQEKVTPARSGEGNNHATASVRDGPRLDGYVLVTNTSAPSGQRTLQTVETRQLIDDGRAHIQVLQKNRYVNARFDV